MQQRVRGQSGHLVCVRHDNSLDWVGVIGRAHQNSFAIKNLNEASQRINLTTQVANESHAIANHNALTAKLARLNSNHCCLVVVQCILGIDASDASAVDSNYLPNFGFRIVRAIFTSAT
jgi:hypothetical protein